jgi:predicted DNA-binding transcriptional regulator AlpA
LRAGRDAIINFGIKQLQEVYTVTKESQETKNVDEFVDFDRLPDDAYIGPVAARKLIGCSKTTLWTLAKEGRIPAPAHITPKIVRWRVGGLRKALREMSGEGRKPDAAA